MRDVQSSECEPHGSIVLVDISSSRFLVIQREETKKIKFHNFTNFQNFAIFKKISGAIRRWTRQGLPSNLIEN